MESLTRNLSNSSGYYTDSDVVFKLLKCIQRVIEESRLKINIYYYYLSLIMNKYSQQWILPLSNVVLWQNTFCLCWWISWIWQHWYCAGKQTRKIFIPWISYSEKIWSQHYLKLNVYFPHFCTVNKWVTCNTFGKYVLQLKLLKILLCYLFHKYYAFILYELILIKRLE